MCVRRFCFAALRTALIVRDASQGPTSTPWLITIAPPDLGRGLALAPVMEGGLRQLITLCAHGPVISRALWEVEIRRKLGIGPDAPFAVGVAILAGSAPGVLRALPLGARGHGSPQGGFSHLDEVWSVGRQSLHAHCNPAHMPAASVFFPNCLALAPQGGPILSSTAVGRGDEDACA